MKKNQVKITADANGNVFFVNAKPGKDGKTYGYFRVVQPRLITGDVAKVVELSALVPMLKSDFDKVASELTNGTMLDGKIVIEETTEQRGNAEPKRAGAEGEILTLDGAPIYRYTKYTTDLNATDSVVKHNNVLTPVSAAQQA